MLLFYGKSKLKSNDVTKTNFEDIFAEMVVDNYL